jgi:hypothetical protein
MHDGTLDLALLCGTMGWSISPALMHTLGRTAHPDAAAQWGTGPRLFLR